MLVTINIVLLWTGVVAYTHATSPPPVSQSCEVCIMNATCTDQTIFFNVSVSRYCRNPLQTYFTYFTDINPKRRYYNKTVTCINCFETIAIDAVDRAWDYTLTLESPVASPPCVARQTAHCGGQSLIIVWLVVGGISGLFVLLGFISCCVRLCRVEKEPVVAEAKAPETAAINDA